MLKSQMYKSNMSMFAYNAVLFIDDTLNISIGNILLDNCHMRLLPYMEKYSVAIGRSAF